MKPLTGTLLIVALSFSVAGMMGCDSAATTSQPNATVASSTESVTFFVEGMV